MSNNVATIYNYTIRKATDGVVETTHILGIRNNGLIFISNPILHFCNKIFTTQKGLKYRCVGITKTNNALEDSWKTFLEINELTEVTTGA